MLISIDFWNTIFDSANGEARNEERVTALKDALLRGGHVVADDDLRAAFRGIWSFFDHHWLEHHRTPTSLEMVREICRVVEAELSDVATEEVADVFERGILRHPPQLLPGVGEALALLSTRARLAIISDTAFSPGRILRQLMEEVGIARHFSAYVFSNETGVAKPHPDAFRHALRMLQGSPSQAVHIGDIERTDIVGAKRVGMHAILYRGDSHRRETKQPADTIADAVVDHWSAMVETIERVVDSVNNDVDQVEGAG